MFTKPIVFVLGAGVSAPFGFPVGRQMKDAICNGGYHDTRGKYISTLAPNDMADVIAAAMDSPDPSLAREFIDGYRQADLYSIDAWLETNRADQYMMRAGKCAIAAVLLYGEHLAATENADVTQDWFSWLWNSMWTPEIGGLDGNDVQFITFNYDRLFEWKLQRQIQNSYLRAKPEEHKKAFKFLRNRVHHIHGVLNGKQDGTPELSGFGVHNIRAIITGNPSDAEGKKRAFGAFVKTHARTINIVCENKGDEDAVESAKIIISKCLLRQQEARLVFLGFGFDERNIIKLNLDQDAFDMTGEGTAAEEQRLDSGKIIGSGKGLLRGERATVKDMLHQKIALGSDSMGAVDFCRSYLRAPSTRLAARRPDAGLV